MVFIEYNIANANQGTFGQYRYNRMRIVRTDTYSSHLPWVMSDSTAAGPKYHEGEYSDNTDYYYYKTDLIEPEITRPAGADVSAAMWRIGNSFRFQVKVTNLSGKTLSSTNSAAVTAIVYEDVVVPAQADQRISDTSRLGLAAPTITINPPLPSGATAIYTLDTPDLTTAVPIHTINWGKLHGVALVDYQPDVTPGTPHPYDMLQGAPAALLSHAPSLTSSDSQLVFPVDLSKPAPVDRQITFTCSPGSLTWSASTDASWITLDPASAPCGTPTGIKIDFASLPVGRYAGTIHADAITTWGDLTVDVPVTMFIANSLKYFYLPILGR